MAEDIVAEEAAAEKSIAGIADETFTDLKDASANLEEAQKSGSQGEIDKAKQAKEVATIKAYTEVVNNTKLTETEKTKTIQQITDFMNTISADPDPTPEKGIKTWWEKCGDLTDKAKETLKSSFKACSDSAKSFFDRFKTPEGRAQDALMEDAQKRMEAAAASGSMPDLEKAGNDYQRARDMFKSKVELDKEADKEGRSKYGDRLWDVMKLLLIAGGFIGALAVIAAELNGCYQYKTGQDSNQIKCNNFYKQDQNQSFCACGSPATPLVCDPTNNYPYCKCDEVHGQVCVLDGTSKVQIYYNYDSTHTAFSLLGDAYDTLKKVVADAPDFLAGVSEWFKKYGSIVAIILGSLIALWIIKMIVEAYNTTRHFVHDLTTGKTTETATPEAHFRLKKK